MNSYASHPLYYMLLAAASLLGMSVHAQSARQQHPLISEQSVERVNNDLIVKLGLDVTDVNVSKSESVVFTPVVSRGDSLRSLPAVVLNGRQRDILYKRLNRKVKEYAYRRNGTDEQHIPYMADTPWADWMKGARVVLVKDSCGCGWQNLGPASHVPVGLIDPDWPLAFIQPSAEVKRYELSGSAFLDFPVDRTEIYPDYRKNPTELQKIIESINTVKNDANARITHISIHGYASPESPYEHNDWLAQHRAAALRDYVCQLMSLPHDIFDIQSTPEDWAGLRRYVSESNINHRSEILALIDGDMAPDPKEWKIKLTYPEEYRFMLANWYPALRHSDYIVQYTVRSFTVEEAKELLHTKPQQLSLNEFYLVAQLYEPGTPEFAEVFDIAVRMYPNEPVANLNAANAALKEGNLDKAAAYLDRAGQSPQAIHARGVLAALKKDYAQGRTYFEQAAPEVPEAAEALQTIQEMMRQP